MVLKRERWGWGEHRGEKSKGEVGFHRGSLFPTAYLLPVSRPSCQPPQLSQKNAQPPAAFPPSSSLVPAGYLEWENVWKRKTKLFYKNWSKCMQTTGTPAELPISEPSPAGGPRPRAVQLLTQIMHSVPRWPSAALHTVTLQHCSQDRTMLPPVATLKLLGGSRNNQGTRCLSKWERADCYHCLVITEDFTSFRLYLLNIPSAIGMFLDWHHPFQGKYLIYG